MKNQISVTKLDVITVEINGQKFNLTYQEAITLYNQLGKELGISTNLFNSPTDKPWTPKYTPVYGDWPSYNPITPYTITCTTQEMK